MEIYTAIWSNKEENNDGKMIMEYCINWKEKCTKTQLLPNLIYCCLKDM